MYWRNTPVNWGALAKLLHWLIALLVLGNLGLGYWAEGLERSALQGDAFYWHKTIGLTVLWLAVLRVAWRLINPVPRPPPGVPAWQRAAARTSHLLLYAAMLGMPVSGWLIHSAGDGELELYGLVAVPDIVPAGLEREAVKDWAGATHYYGFWVLGGLIAIHVAGALKHHIVDGDSVLRRMLPFSRASDPIRGR